MTFKKYIYLTKIKQMDKTIEILEKSIKFAKKQLLDNWEKLEDNEVFEIKRGLTETMNLIETLKVINRKL